MTFSDQKIVDLVNENFVALWESVAPVKVAIFDLGNGRKIRGTVGGEIALYFCRPDGKVFDILPALHSPAATRDAIENALAFYQRTGATDEAIAEYHQAQLAYFDGEGLGVPTPEMFAHQEELAARQRTSDPATADLSEMLFSKTAAIVDSEPIVVVEPGGFHYYKRRVHDLLAYDTPRDHRAWREPLFVGILNQPLVGGVVEYNSDSLAPLTIIED